MLIRCRYFFIALAGLALVGNGPSPAGKAQSETVSRQQSSKQVRAPAASSAPKVNVNAAPDSGCERGKDDRKSDLCAQWKAADAAYDAARWSWWQLIIGIAGIVLGVLTMSAAIAAAIYARRAAVATENSVTLAENAAAGAASALAIAERNAKAAEDALSDSRDEAYLRLRPYVHLGDTTILEGTSDGKVWGETYFHNYGQTPAERMCVMVSHRVVEPTANITDIVDGLPPIDTSHGRSLVQGRYIVGQIGPLTIEEVQASIDGRKKIVVIARAEYGDIIQQNTHQTREVWEIKSRFFRDVKSPRDSFVEHSFVHLPQFWIGT